MAGKTAGGNAAPAVDRAEFPYWRRNLYVLSISNLLCSIGFSLAWPRAV